MFHISKYPTGFQLTYRNFWPTLPDPWSFSQTCTVGKNGSGDSCPSHLDTHAPWICIIQSTCAFSKKNIFFSFSKGYRAVTTRARGVLPARRRSQTKLSLSPATGETYTPTYTRHSSLLFGQVFNASPSISTPRKQKIQEENFQSQFLLSCNPS